jgi:hypothetical protein
MTRKGPFTAFRAREVAFGERPEKIQAGNVFEERRR